MVLVTGGSGFVGVHVILALLRAGHAVRTTLRSPARRAEVLAMLAADGVEPGDRLTFATADLTADAGWAEAAAGCERVLHVASPFPAAAPRHEDDLIRPARDGTLRVLRAARDAGARRVVVTSSFAAIGYGHPPQTAPYDETSWTNTDHANVTAYAKSKTLAERAAWEFASREGLELATVNPVMVFGPVLGPDPSTSIVLVQRLVQGVLPGCPRLWFGAVDVRDVADLHVRAMTDPAAAGERFLAVSGPFLSVLDMARILRDALGSRGSRIPTRQLPDVLVRVAALLDPEVRAIVPELGARRDATAAKAQRVLGWAPRSPAEALVATAESLRRLEA